MSDRRADRGIEVRRAPSPPNRTREGEEPRGASTWRTAIVLALAIVVWGGAGAGTAQTVELETHVSADSVVVGERFTVSLTATRDPAAEVSFPDPDSGDLVFGELEVLGRTDRLDVERGARRMDSVAYEVTTFALDSVQVPGLPVQFAAGADTIVRSAPPRTVTVVSVVPADAEGLYSVAGLAAFPHPWWSWAVLGLTVSGLLGGLVYLWWRRRTSASGSQPVPTNTEQTPYEAATSWIRQLESYDLSDPDAVKPFYVELSSALRVYLARELDVSALEQTTREVTEALDHRADVPPEAVARLRAVLELADLVKFADAHPTADDHEKALREARAALDAIEAPPHTPAPESIDGVASAS